ncbi:hypothetical protein CHS0354_028507 [Potamilus streckersoni]|uniref:Uncharacterized protein n=1 Tax=Potamilus streckersoni TaxID=2493646 RepID=A0AAE0SEH8_9BIVA|nr:hypothetical protein CHS0354_028507 [Potamilus streckersoni]
MVRISRNEKEFGILNQGRELIRTQLKRITYLQLEKAVQQSARVHSPYKKTGQAASLISSSKAKTTVPTSNEMSLSWFHGMSLQSPSNQYLLRNYTPASSQFVSYATNVSTSRRNRSEIVERRHTLASQRNSIQTSSNRAKTYSPDSKEASSATFPNQSFYSSISRSRLMNTKPLSALSDSDSSYISSEMKNHLEMAVKRGFSTPQESDMVQVKNTRSEIIHQHRIRLSQIQQTFNPDEMSFRNG